MSRTTVVLDAELQEHAKALGLNISEICREALRDAVAAKKLAAQHGDDYESVTADLWHDRYGDETERVQFLGKKIHYDEEAETDWYITQGGNFAAVNFGEGRRLTFSDDLENLDPPGWIRQMIEEALGEVPTPTVLDI